MLTDKVPPFNLEAEQAVLGAILVSPEVMQKARHILCPDDFYRTEHRNLFQLFIDFQETGHEINTVTIGDSDFLQKCGGSAYVSSLVDELPTTSTFDSAVKIVKRDAHKRDLIKTARKLEAQAFNGGDPAELTATYRERLKRLEDEHYRAGLIVKEIPIASKIIPQVLANIQKNKAQGSLGIDPGFAFLRKVIAALIASHLWVIGGYTSTGKTALVVEIISRILFSISWAHVAVFSLEMSVQQYILRLVANKTGVPSLAILKGSHLHDIQKQIDQAFESISKKNLTIYDDLYDWPAIAETARHLKRVQGLDVMVVDYLQNVSGQGSLYERMSSLAPQLQALAKELGCTVLALSQVSNEAVIETSPLIAFKGAGEIAASADLALWLERDKETGRPQVNSDTLNVIVRKNRHGSLGRARLQFKDSFTRLEEIN